MENLYIYIYTQWYQNFENLKQLTHHVRGDKPYYRGRSKQGGMGGVGSLKFSMYQRYGKQASMWQIVLVGTPSGREWQRHYNTILGFTLGFLIF